MTDMTDSVPRAKFNVLHVVSKLPLGGVENMLMKVVKGYDRNRFDPRVCCIKEGGEIADALVRSGYPVEVLGRMKKHGFDWGAVAGLVRVIKENNIHILRTHQYHANLYGRLAGLLAGVPVMIPSFHSRYVSPRQPKLHRRIINYLLGRVSDAMVAVSPSVRSDVIRYDGVSPEKIRVIYNGVNLSDFDPNRDPGTCRAAMNLPLHDIIIGTVGRLKEEKGHRFLIEAASQVEGVTVAFAGGGPLREELQRLSQACGCRCLFLDMIPPAKIPLFLGSLDIFCFPSLWEGFPTSVIEAMAAGLPVVASDIPSIAEIVGDAGMLVAPGDSSALARCLQSLRSDQDRRKNLARQAVEQIQKFAIENTVSAYQELFEENLRRKGLLV